MHILGVSCYYHDSAAAILRDGDLVAAAQEERFSRIKHDSGYPKRAINFCVETAGINSSDLDYVAFYEKPLRKFDRILKTVLQTYPSSYQLFREATLTWATNKLWIESQLCSSLKIPRSKVLFASIISLMPPAPSSALPLIAQPS
jgi:carbamoyltransferase